MNESLRCYTFTIYQLSPIQQGIQAGHAAVELLATSNDGRVKEWATDHKTMVCLNGGDVAELNKIIGLLSSTYNTFPWATFTESQESLAGITTSVAIILPSRIFAYLDRKSSGSESLWAHPTVHSDWEKLLLGRLNASKLAR